MTLSNADWERLNYQLLFSDSERVERTLNYFNSIDSEIHISETNGVVSVTSPRLEFDKIKSAIKIKEIEE